MASACALAIFSGKNIFYRADSDSLRAVRICIFTGRVVMIKWHFQTANAGYLCAPSREKVVPKRPQAFRNYK